MTTTELIIALEADLLVLKAKIASDEGRVARADAILARHEAFLLSNDLDDLKPPLWRVSIYSQGTNVSPHIQTQTPLPEGSVEITGTPGVWEVRADVKPEPITQTLSDHDSANTAEPWGPHYVVTHDWTLA